MKISIEFLFVIEKSFLFLHSSSMQSEYECELNKKQKQKETTKALIQAIEM